VSQNPDDRRVLDALGRSVPQVAPPAELRARVLAAATRGAGAPDAADIAPACESFDPASPRRETPPDERTDETPPHEPKRRVQKETFYNEPRRVQEDPPYARASRWPWGLAAAAAIVAAVTSVGWLSASGEITRLQTALADARANATQLRAVRDEFERERSRNQRAAAILGASDVTYTALAGVAPVEQARGRIYVSPTRGLLFAAEDLPVLPPNRSYQLWTIAGGKPVSHGVFEPGTNGAAQLLADPAPGMAEAYAVTVEPLGGVAEPTGTKVLLGSPIS
jgi:anti-sigma-K factor RskA